MTTLVVLQPGYLPWLGFFDQMKKADVFVYYDDVQFDKNGWRNRNRIKGSKGPVWLTVPVRHKGRSEQSIQAVEVIQDQLWATKHVKSIRELYAHAPFTKDYLDGLEAVLSGPKTHLVDFCYAAVEYFRGVLEIDTPMFRSSDLNIEGKRSERLVNICNHFQADTYLSGDSAKSYLQDDLFKDAGIDVQWQNYQHPTYDQQHGAFISHLSIVDLVMNMGPDSGTIFSNK
jgi:hypothetical protein